MFSEKHIDQKLIRKIERIGMSLSLNFSKSPQILPLFSQAFSAYTRKAKEWLGLLTVLLCKTVRLQGFWFQKN